MSSTHRMTGTPAWNSWRAMRGRCRNKNTRHYKNYGGRGITVCSQWDDFLVFLKDMGERPPGHTLERIDNNKGYSPENCKWASRKEQQINRRDVKTIEVNGQKFTALELAHKLGFANSSGLLRRLNKYGWDLEKALTKRSERAKT